MGDDGSIEDAEATLRMLDGRACDGGRSHWGVTVLQATDQMDAGPVWAFDQVELDVEEQGLTKSSLYRGSVSRAAISAVVSALERITIARTEAARQLAGIAESSCDSGDL